MSTEKTAMIPVENFSSAIRVGRRWAGLTQKQVAAELGIPYQDYQRYEYGLFIPSKERVCKLAAIFGLDVYNLRQLAVRDFMNRY